MRHIRSSAAFTLIELLVVTGIITVVTAVVLANHNVYDGQVILQSFAYDLALSVRQAQVYGIAVQRFGSGQTSTFGNGYGVHFNTADPTHYDLFSDAQKTGLYASGEDVDTSPFTIGRGYFIYKLCAPAGADAASCTALNTLDILFVRPEPDAYIAANSAQCYNTGSSCINDARIVVKSPKGDTMSVTVSENGQISVDQKSLP